MFNRKVFLLLFLFLIIVATASAVSASDLANDTVADSDSDKIEANENNNIKIDDEIIGASDGDVLKDDAQWGTFTNLQKIIDDAEEGVSIMPHYVTAKLNNADNIVFVPMAGDDEKVEVIVAWSKEDRNPVLQRFTHFIEDTFLD